MKSEILTWILCGSHGKFENSQEGVFGFKVDLNPDWILYESQFYYRY